MVAVVAVMAAMVVVAVVVAVVVVVVIVAALETVDSNVVVGRKATGIVVEEASIGYEPAFSFTNTKVTDAVAFDNPQRVVGWEGSLGASSK